MGWNEIFKEKGKFFHTPHKDIQKAVKLIKRGGKVLDLGCGTGRHTVMLAKKGFQVYGLDNAPSGLKQCKEWLDKLGLKGNLKLASCYKRFPYKDDYFDALISVQVIHHARLKDIEVCIKEMKRVLKPGGVIFVTVTKNKMKYRATKVKLIEPRTYVMLDGFEKGVPHFIYTKALLRKYFSNFNILELFIDKHEHYCLLGKLKE